MYMNVARYASSMAGWRASKKKKKQKGKRKLKTDTRLL